MNKIMAMTVPVMVLTGVMSVQAMFYLSRGDATDRDHGISRAPQSISFSSRLHFHDEQVPVRSSVTERFDHHDGHFEKAAFPERNGGSVGKHESGRRSFDDCTATIGEHDGSHGCSRIPETPRGNDFSHFDHSCPGSGTISGGLVSSVTRTHPRSHGTIAGTPYRGPHHGHGDDNGFGFGSYPGFGTGTGAGSGLGPGPGLGGPGLGGPGLGGPGLGGPGLGGPGLGGPGLGGPGLGGPGLGGPGLGGPGLGGTVPDPGSNPGSTPIPSTILLFVGAFMLLLGIKKNRLSAAGTAIRTEEMEKRE